VKAEIRRLREADVATFRRIRLEALEREPASFASAVDDWAGASEAEWLALMRAVTIFAAFAGGEPVGLMGLGRQRGSRIAHRATLVMVYVRADRRGGGLADALLDAAFAAARADGVRQVELTASAENAAALAFYRRRRFEEVGRMPAGFVHDGREVDEVSMVVRL
jgi:ribosomal protein S18 acetylase RimI-like enzyme